MAGEVPGDSIDWEAQDFQLTFDVVQGDDCVSAVYRGVRPDNLIDGANVVLEGTFGANGVFTVDRLLVQCVSKYEAADPGRRQPGRVRGNRRRACTRCTSRAEAGFASCGSSCGMSPGASTGGGCWTGFV